MEMSKKLYHKPHRNNLFHHHHHPFISANLSQKKKSAKFSLLFNIITKLCNTKHNFLLFNEMMPSKK